MPPPSPDHRVIKVTWTEAYELARQLERRVCESHGDNRIAAYPVPRGGLFVAAMLAGSGRMNVVDEPQAADIAIDDIVDSGATARRLRAEHGLEIYALIDKRTGEYPGRWIEWPWEIGGREADLRDTIIRLCQQVGVELPLP